MNKIKALDLLLSIKEDIFQNSDLTIDNDEKSLGAATSSIIDYLKKIETMDKVLLDRNEINEFLKGKNNIEVIFTNEDSIKILLLMRERWEKEKQSLEVKDKFDKGLLKTYIYVLLLTDRMLQSRAK